MNVKQTMAIFALTASGAFGSLLISQQACADDSADLAKQLNNPIASLISLPMKVDWDTDIGSADADKSTWVVQPVIPVSFNKDVNLISRTITPVYVDAESPVAGGTSFSGMGDILQSFFFSPKAATSSGWIWGGGPVFSLPTGDDGVTSDKFSLGPTGVALKQTGAWTYGGLFNHLWSVSGDDDAPDVSNTFIQPFLAYTTDSSMTFSVNSESSYNWESKEWTVPVNVSISQLFKFGKRPVNFALGYRNYLDAPSGGPDWGIRFTVTLLYPK